MHCQLCITSCSECRSTTRVTTAPVNIIIIQKVMIISNDTGVHSNTGARCVCPTSCPDDAGMGLWLVVMGGRTADIGWFRTKTDSFLNDTVVMDR